MNRTKEVGVRLSVTNKDGVVHDFRLVGREGREAMERIATATRPVNAAMLALNSSVTVGKQAFFGWGTGVLAAVASALSLSSAIAQVRESLDHMGEIADRSKSTGLDPEFLQELTYQAELAGVQYEKLGGALETFIRGAGMASEGKGRMVSQLRALNPELLENIQLATTQEERVRLAADAINDEADAARKAALANALFGESGTRLVDVFDGGADAMERMAREARNLGVIIDRHVIRQAEEMGDELEVAQKIIDVNLKTAIVNVAPTLIWFAELLATISGSVRRMSDALKDLEDRSSTTLNERMRELGLERLQLHNESLGLPKRPDNAWDIGANIEFNLSQGRAAQIAERNAAIEAEEKRILEILEGRKPEEPELPALPPELPPSEGANKALEEARSLIERLRTASEEYSATVANLKDMQAAGLIGQETYNRGVAEAALKFAGAADGAKEYEAAQAALDDALRQGIITEVEYTKAVEDMTQRRLAASNDWLAGMERGLRLIAQEGGDFGKNIEDTLVSAASSFEDALVDAFESGKVGWEDLRKQIMSDILRMGIRQGISGLSSIINTFFNGGSMPLRLGYQAGVGHTGATIGASAANRIVPAEIFYQAPRHHTGTDFLKPGEVPFIGMRGEEIGWPDQLRRKYGGQNGSLVVNVKVVNESGQPVAAEAGQPQQTSGGVDIEVMLKPIVKGVMREDFAAGGMDGLMGQIYGVKRLGRS